MVFHIPRRKTSEICINKKRKLVKLNINVLLDLYHLVTELSLPCVDCNCHEPTYQTHPVVQRQLAYYEPRRTVSWYPQTTSYMHKANWNRFHHVNNFIHFVHLLQPLPRGNRFSTWGYAYGLRKSLFAAKVGDGSNMSSNFTLNIFVS